MHSSSLLGCIIQGMWDEWSGTIDVKQAELLLGQVVMAQGKIAWATSNRQTENLASLVWRLSYISVEQLSTVSKLYYRHKGKRKIGAILEQEGLMSRPVLRRCLMLHIRFALANLFSHGDALVDPRPDSLATDEDILFLPEEVLPFAVISDFAKEWVQHNRDAAYWQQVTAENNMLAPLFELPGYLASAVVSAHGGVVVAHGKVDWMEPRILAVLVASVMERSMELASVVELGQVRATMVEFGEGYLGVRWVDDSQQFACVTITDHDGNLGHTLSGLDRISVTIASWLDEVRTGQDAQSSTGG